MDPSAGPPLRWTPPSAGQPSDGQPSAGQPSAGQPSAGQPSAGQPSAGPPKISLFFSPPPVRHNFHSSFSLLGVLSLHFVGVFEGRNPEMCTFGVLGLSCASPGGPVQKFNIQKLAEVKIGRSQNWPKSKLAEVEIGRSRSRSPTSPSRRFGDASNASGNAGTLEGAVLAEGDQHTLNVLTDANRRPPVPCDPFKLGTDRFFRNLPDSHGV